MDHSQAITESSPSLHPVHRLLRIIQMQKYVKTKHKQLFHFHEYNIGIFLDESIKIVKLYE